MLLITSCQKDVVIKAKDTIDITNWQLDVTESHFSFVTIKNKNHAEENTIDFAQGSIDELGNLSLSLDLASVDTIIERRNERLRDILFEVEQYPEATIKTTLTRDLPLNSPVEVEFELSLHGVTKKMKALVMIQKAGQQLVVINYEPVLVNGKDFNLDAAINQLTQIAGLQSINYEVLTDFKLTFGK
ncbi:MAG: YceI family protein [Marinicella sp.]